MGSIPIHFISIYWPHRSRRKKILSSIADFPGNHAVVWLYGIDFSERFFCAYSTSAVFSPNTFLVWFPLTLVLVFPFGVLSRSYPSCPSLYISPDLTAHVPILTAKHVHVCIAQSGLFQLSPNTSSLPVSIPSSSRSSSLVWQGFGEVTDSLKGMTTLSNVLKQVW